MRKPIKKILRDSDSILSFVVGIVLVVVIAMLTYSIIRSSRQFSGPANDQGEKMTVPTIYTVKDGDTLWDIAMTYYQSGYNWVDIARTNDLENPDGLAIGQVLAIPDAKTIHVETGQILDGATTEPLRPLHSEVTVVQGESLWSIAEREYGTGYTWVDIAKANAIITNPDIIYPGTNLRLP